MSVVLDGSVTLAWFFEDEQTDASRAVLAQVTKDGAIVPRLWRYEVANGLQMAVIRKRIDAEFRDGALARLSRLPIDVDSEGDAQLWSASVQLADRYGLTIYDAAYLELAQRCRLPLATLDKKLIRAGRSELVATVGH